MEPQRMPPSHSERSPAIQEIDLKCSDFSIDHILNRAGSRQIEHQLDDKFEMRKLENRPMNDMSDFYIENSTNFTPILNWLQYTRYHPPKLPRPVKNGPAKRTPGRLPRIPFTPYQLCELENAYRKANYMSSDDANKLAIKLDLTCVRVSGRMNQLTDVI